MDKRFLKSKRANEECISFPLRILDNRGRNKSDKTTKRTFNCQGYAVREMDNQQCINEWSLLKENTLNKDFEDVKVKGEKPQSLCKQIGMVGRWGKRGY